MTQRAHFWTAAFCAAVVVTSVADMTIPAAAQPSTAGGDQAQIDLNQIDLGKKAYAQTCSHCHGPNMVNGGTITPDLRKFPDDRARFFTTVKLGKNGKMPPWGDLLNDDQIAELWAYISSRRDQ